MKFEAVGKATLPPLAWCARIGRGDPAVRVCHGKGVESGDDFICEGAWSGAYAEQDFARAMTFTGTGVCIGGHEGVWLVAPTHTLQAIYLLRAGDEVLASNSLPFLLSQGNDGVDTRYKFYDYDIMSIMKGLGRYTRKIPTRNGRWIHLYYHCNVLVTSDLDLVMQAKQAPPSFETYAEYYSFLQGEVRAVSRNANDVERKIRYALLTTISSGYDSPACSVLAKAAGCDQAVTFKKARSGENDSGKEIADVLGLEVQEYDPDEYLKRADFPEAEFIATGYGGDDVIMASLEKVLPGKLLLTGYHGDKVWAREGMKVGPDIVRGDASGGALGEFRLRVGFINLPVPFIGCVHHPLIQKISNSREMREFSLPDTAYDRPLPRRMVEESGVPRHLFGQKKKMIARPYQTTGLINPPLERVMSEHSCQDFYRFAESLPLFDSLFDRVLFSLKHALYRFNLRLIQSVKMKAVCARLGITLPYEPLVSWRYSKPRTVHCLAFHWAVERMKPRYRLFPAPKRCPEGVV